MKKIFEFLLDVLVLTCLILFCMVLVKQLNQKKIEKKVIQPTLSNNECYEVTYKKEKYKVCGTGVKKDG